MRSAFSTLILVATAAVTLTATTSAQAAPAPKSCGIVRELISRMKTKHLLQVVLDNTETGRREIHTVGAIDVNLSMLTRALGSTNVQVCLEKFDDGQQSTVSNLYTR